MMVRSQWEPFADAVKALELPMRRIVLTHGHIDHVGGTKAFPHAGVFASPQTSEVLDQRMPIDAYKTFMSAFEEEFDDLAELGTRPATHLIDGAASLTPRVEVLPAKWADVLEAVVDLADTIVPGHGPVGSEREVRDLQAYLRACVDAKGDPTAIPPGPWDTWLERERDAINVERAALLAEGRDEIPPSMLHAIGCGEPGWA